MFYSRKAKHLFPFFLLLLWPFASGYSQCINTFPHTESFESAAVWTSGGNNSDWTWGTPSKAVINAAGAGNKCWIIGGLSSSSYNGSQKSYIESPCYDFTNLHYPYASFKVFWETEYKYDGASLQYSDDNGASWQTVGMADETPDCMNPGWYNYNAINFLTWINSNNGWSGNSKSTLGGCQGGNGSLGWVNAKHCLGGLAGKAQVKFRFVFGSGTSCNAFDGFAMDEFTIDDASAGFASFTYTCSDFTGFSTACTTPTAYAWNFGDPSSGSANSASGIHSTHTFNAAGIYTVSLSAAGGPCGAQSSLSKTIAVIGVTIPSATNVLCYGGSNGSALASPQFANGPFTYAWAPAGGSNATATDLTAGHYTVIVHDGSGCSGSDTISIHQPELFRSVSSQSTTVCLGDKGVLDVSADESQGHATYSWSPGSYTTGLVQVSPSGNSIYSVDIVISGTCPQNIQKQFTVNVAPKPAVAFKSTATEGCMPMEVGFEDMSTSAGSIQAYRWSFGNGNFTTTANPVMTFADAGSYTVNLTVTNDYGCSSTGSNPLNITVRPVPAASFKTDKTEVSELAPTVDFTSTVKEGEQIEWNFGGLGSSTLQSLSYSFDGAGNYPVLLTAVNEYGCSNTTLQLIKVLPEFAFYAPDSFTPNNDGLNDLFLPVGNGWNTETFELWVYDRWGEKIFYSHDFTAGWNGKVRGNDSPVAGDTFFWKVQLKDVSRHFYSFMGMVRVIK